ncbi:glycosyltransferase [Brevundimonas sp. NIBR11]|uniref:glycosyltransferase n=1 Tax=Brevundimonas sp. NIBR11 TaxID=3015999 RepID=UPI0022F0120E|nr:glycosyltransferase [Brevundimonas sp. NIBR11]WGM31835.1 D-inositol-3-phosphate glycosyltransferase [Brevundimonas sp. NIBR11]
MTRALPSILIVDQSAEIGGAELSMLDFATRYDGPLEICVLAEGPFAALARERGVAVSVIPLGKVSEIRRGDSGFSLMRVASGLWSTGRRLGERARSFDLVIGNTLKAFVIAALARPLHRRPVVFHLHDLLTAEHFSLPLRIGVVLLARLAAWRAIMNSEATAASFVKTGGRREQVRVVYNGIDPTPFEVVDRSAARAALIAETSLCAERPIVGVFSRLAEWKGQHVLLEALARLSDVQAVIVGGPLFGEDAYEARLRRLISDFGLDGRVRMTGFRKDVPSLMCAVDVVLHTSTSAEPFGRVIVEGQLARKPVIATRAGGAVELIRDGETGILVTPGDSAALAEAIGGLVDRPDHARAMAEAGYGYATGHFLIDRHVANMRLALDIDAVDPTQEPMQ